MTNDSLIEKAIKIAYCDAFVWPKNELGFSRENFIAIIQHEEQVKNNEEILLSNNVSKPSLPSEICDVDVMREGLVALLGQEDTPFTDDTVWECADRIIREIRSYFRTTEPVSVSLESGAIVLCEKGGNSSFQNSWIEKSEKTKNGYRASAKALAETWGLAYVD